MQWKSITVLLLMSVLFMQHSVAIAQTTQCKDTDGQIIPFSKAWKLEEVTLLALVIFFGFLVLKKNQAD